MTKNRPIGKLLPENKELLQIKKFIHKQEYDSALEALEKLKELSPYENNWRYYLQGLALFGKEKWQEGLVQLQKLYEHIKQNSKEKSTNFFRLAATALKKVGWLYRRNKEYEKAYAFHSIELKYYEEYGSFWELHDAMISLDNDAYWLKDLHISKMWLENSVEVGEKIVDNQDRYQSLGISWNNLGSTLSALEQFEKAEKAITTSLGYWQQYEDLTGSTEFKVVWAYYGVADVYLSWAKYLKNDNKDYKEKQKQALHFFNKSLTRAQEQKIPQEEQKYIKDKITETEKL